MAGRRSFILDVMRSMRAVGNGKWKMEIVPVATNRKWIMLPYVDPSKNPHAFYVVLSSTVRNDIPVQFIYVNSFPELYDMYARMKKFTTVKAFVYEMYTQMRDRATKAWLVRTLRINQCGFASSHRFGLTGHFNKAVDFKMESKNE